MEDGMEGTCFIRMDRIEYFCVGILDFDWLSMTHCGQIFYYNVL